MRATRALLAGSRCIRVISERKIAANMDMTVQRLMESVEAQVKKQPGLLQYETLRDCSDETVCVLCDALHSFRLFLLAASFASVEGRDI